MDNNFNQCIKQVTKLCCCQLSKDNQNKRNLYDILFLLDEASDAVISAECKENIVQSHVYKFVGIIVCCFGK
jgi:hypothetical protein